jgi:hypothetical protein
VLKGLVEILGCVELLVVAHQLVLQFCYLYTKNTLVCSVADPDVFGPPGSGSISTRYRSGSGSRSGSFYQ